MWSLILSKGMVDVNDGSGFTRSLLVVRRELDSYLCETAGPNRGNTEDGNAETAKGRRGTIAIISPNDDIDDERYKSNYLRV